jgi:hypothetical protein
MKINHWVSQSFFELRVRDMHPDMTGICPGKKHVSDYKTLISDSGALIRKVPYDLAITFSRRAYSNRWASAIFSGFILDCAQGPLHPQAAAHAWHT